MSKIRILLVDDHKMIREGIKAFLDENNEYVIVAEAKNGVEALEFYKTKDIDVVLTDIMMPVKNGIDLTTDIIVENPDAKIIALTMLNEKPDIKQMIKAGAMGYLLKNCSEEQLNSAIKTVMEGEKYYSAEVTEILASDSAHVSGPGTRLSLEIPLTQREEEVLHLICKEYTNKEMSDELFISMRTIDAHKRNLLEKTGCKNVAGLVIYAIERNLFDDL